MLTEYIFNVIKTLRTPYIASLVERLIPFLHKDPVAILPPEITYEVFTHLPPTVLLDASSVSRAWRERTTDSRLWRQKFIGEGWTLNMAEVRRFEQDYQVRLSQRKTRSRRPTPFGEERTQKRRTQARTEEVISPSLGALQESLMRGLNLPAGSSSDGDNMTPLEDQEMGDAEPPKPEPSSQDIDMLSRMDTFGSTSRTPASIFGNPPVESPKPFLPESSIPLTKPSVLEPPYLVSNHWEPPSINFQYLFKQRRKLEENWTAGKFKSFQLPHRDHPGEAHTECVYTIQYSGKYLVSGSRDRTLRIWNLETQRLVTKPLCGHSGSVLCLQFDAAEKEDIIISGSSDTDVIIWRFSTGEVIKKLTEAHTESVLNLKFDDRFLVTCSKDKTIKIWNRRDLKPGDANYPIRNTEGGGKCPTYILDLSKFATPMDMETSLSPEERAPIPPFNLIMTLDTHTAAVNAIHIYKDQLVSASGDRSLKIFNIHTGVCTALCTGHTKGIACVQYDGKRIVSGSSDKTIRIFDPVSHAEVACLAGHQHLVRTVQASFADKPGSANELAEEARKIDRQYFEARRSGAIPMVGNRTRERNPGSRRPEHIMAYGAKLPPGGGGSRWGRIISGSYDETVIIWKKTPEGPWVIAHRLRQADALRAAGSLILAQSERSSTHRPPPHQPQPAHPFNLTLPLPGPSTNVLPPPLQQQQPLLSSTQLVQHAMQTGAAALQNGMHNVLALNQQLGGNTQQQPPPHTNQLAPLQHFASQHAYHAVQLQYHQQNQQLQALQSNHAHQAHQPTIHLPHHHHHPPAQQQQLPPLQSITGAQQNSTQQGPSPPATAPATTNNNAQHHGPQHPPPQHHHHAMAAATAAAAAAAAAAQQGGQAPHTHQANQANARVFKLQFDARRIICCSQDPKIVGWDFANGDREIEDVSRFFGEPT